MISIGILTSSRADFGIYLPLLKKLQKDNDFKFEIIAFGTHLSHCHGYTIEDILEQGFTVKYQIESLVLGDTEEAITTSIGLTIIKFSSFWEAHKKEFDIVFCLGDRYEMFAAVIAGVPFNIRFAHLHGGEKTLGAIDNTFRHAITAASSIHFASTQTYADRIKEIVEKENINIFNVGALGIDNIISQQFYNNDEFLEIWGIDLSMPTILVTLHPETVEHSKNEIFAEELSKAIMLHSEYQYIITMPNADTSGNSIRKIFNHYVNTTQNIKLIENFGTKGYLTCMRNAVMLIGNSSSGIIEAASFGKYVINIGNRQKGRLTSHNVIHVPIERKAISKTIQKVKLKPIYIGDNIYGDGKTAMRIVDILKKLNCN